MTTLSNIISSLISILGFCAVVIFWFYGVAWYYNTWRSFTNIWNTKEKFRFVIFGIIGTAICFWLASICAEIRIR